MKKNLLGLCLLLLAGQAWSQSYNFSQFFSTPLLVNPANTGFTSGPYRFASNIRSQGGISNTFFTGYVSADVSLLRDRLPSGHKAGIGIYAMNEHSFASAFKTNTIGISTAYNVGLDRDGRQTLGLGLQGTFNLRKVDFTKLSFENQYTSGGFNTTLPTGEELYAKYKQFFDLNTGVVYNYISERQAFFAGVSVYNLLNHKENLAEPEFNMPTRYTFQAGAQFYLNDQSKIYTSMTGMQQAKTGQVTLGAAYGLLFNEAERDELIGGLWYRFNDAVIPYVGFQRQNFQVGFSFDYTASGFKTSSQIKNAYELSLIYKATDKRELKTHIPWF